MLVRNIVPLCNHDFARTSVQHFHTPCRHGETIVFGVGVKVRHNSLFAIVIDRPIIDGGHPHRLPNATLFLPSLDSRQLVCTGMVSLLGGLPRYAGSGGYAADCSHKKGLENGRVDGDDAHELVCWLACILMLYVCLSYRFADGPDRPDINLLGVLEAEDAAEEGSEHDENAAAEPDGIQDSPALRQNFLSELVVYHTGRAGV